MKNSYYDGRQTSKWNNLLNYDQKRFGHHFSCSFRDNDSSDVNDIEYSSKWAFTIQWMKRFLNLFLSRSIDFSYTFAAVILSVEFRRIFILWSYSIWFFHLFIVWLIRNHLMLRHSWIVIDEIECDYFQNSSETQSIRWFFFCTIKINIRFIQSFFFLIRKPKKRKKKIQFCETSILWIDGVHKCKQYY